MQIQNNMYYPNVNFKSSQGSAPAGTTSTQMSKEEIRQIVKEENKKISNAGTIFAVAITLLIGIAEFSHASGGIKSLIKEVGEKTKELIGKVKK